MGHPTAQRHVVARRFAAGGSALALIAVAVNALAAATRMDPAPHVFAFVSGAGAAVVRDLQRHGRRIDVVAPNWFALRPSDLEVVGAPRPSVIAAAGAVGAQVWPVINARLGGGAVLARPAARRRIADEIIAVAARGRFSGVTLDLEQVLPARSGAFGRLVADRLHAHRERLAVYVPRRTAVAGDRAYDWGALVQDADLLIASGYDSTPPRGRPAR